MHFLCKECRGMGSSLKIIFDHFFKDQCFLVIAFTCFSYSLKFSNLFVFFLFYMKHENRSSLLGSG